MNWGNKLLLVFIVFGVGMSYMVYRCMQTPVDLVSEHYYKDELAYQQVIDGKRQANRLSSRVSLELTAEGVGVLLPGEMKGRQVRGSIQFYCPSNVRYDRVFSLTDVSLDIPMTQLRPGRYTVKVSWVADRVGYFSEQDLMVP